jgi:hypothetical protein
MAFTDPQSVTINAVTSPLPRTFSEGNESRYTSADGLIALSANHTLVKQGRERHLLRIDHSKLTTNPFDSSENVKVNMAYYVVFDLPPAGYTDAEALQVFVGFNTLITASSNALITKLLGGES